jgi:tRNA dimethylallyltransferase
MRQKVIALVGPTASGKSSLGVFLAKKLNGEVISADSRQVYKGLDIGTGKVTKKEMGGVRHHLLDVSSPKKRFSVDRFAQLGHKAARDMKNRDAVPVVVGGTGLYADILLGRMSYADVPPNEPLRKKLEKKSVGELFLQLKKKDARRADTIEPHNKRRLIRALEVAAAIGKNPEPAPESRYKVLWLGLSPAETVLKKNIAKRLKARIKAGMVAEGKRLHVAGLSYKRMEELGLEYRFLSQLLQKNLTPKEFTLGLERAIGQYAKRQKKWFRRNKDIRWVRNKTEALRLAKGFLSR